MNTESPTVETPIMAGGFDPAAAYAAFIQKAAEFGFTNEIDEDSGQPEHWLFNRTKYEIQRIAVPVDYLKADSPIWFIVIDRLSYWPYQTEESRDIRRTTFYRANLDITDMDFIGQLILNIFPKTATPAPY